MQMAKAKLIHQGSTIFPACILFIEYYLLYDKQQKYSPNTEYTDLLTAIQLISIGQLPKIIVGNLVSLKVNKGQLSSWFDLYHVKS
jgi:hypothetical protein